MTWLPGARCSGVMDLNVPHAGGGDVALKAKRMLPTGHTAGKGLGWASGSICVLSGLFPEHMDLVCEVAELGRHWEHEMPRLLVPLLSPLLLILFCCFFQPKSDVPQAILGPSSSLSLPFPLGRYHPMPTSPESMCPPRAASCAPDSQDVPTGMSARRPRHHRARKQLSLPQTLLLLQASSHKQQLTESLSLERQAAAGGA